MMYILVLIPASVCIYTICRKKNMYSKYMDQDVSRIWGMEIDVMTFDWIASIKDTGEKPHPSHRTGDLFVFSCHGHVNSTCLG